MNKQEALISLVKQSEEAANLRKTVVDQLGSQILDLAGLMSGVIGSGGKVIREIVEVSGAKVDIKTDNLCRAVSISESAWTVDVAKRALKQVGIKAETVFITGFTESLFGGHVSRCAEHGAGIRKRER